MNLWTHSVYIKLRLKLQGLTALKIGGLLLTANSPNLSDLTIWRASVSGKQQRSWRLHLSNLTIWRVTVNDQLS